MEPAFTNITPFMSPSQMITFERGLSFFQMGTLQINHTPQPKQNTCDVQ